MDGLWATGHQNNFKHRRITSTTKQFFIGFPMFMHQLIVHSLSKIPAFSNHTQYTKIFFMRNEISNIRNGNVEWFSVSYRITRWFCRAKQMSFFHKKSLWTIKETSPVQMKKKFGKQTTTWSDLLIFFDTLHMEDGQHKEDVWSVVS